MLELDALLTNNPKDCAHIGIANTYSVMRVSAFPRLLVLAD